MMIINDDDNNNDNNYSNNNNNDDKNKKRPLTLWDNQSAKNTGLGCTSLKFVSIYLLVTLAHPDRQRLDRIHVSVCIQLTTHSRGISKGFST